MTEPRPESVRELLDGLATQARRRQDLAAKLAKLVKGFRTIVPLDESGRKLSPKRVLTLQGVAALMGVRAETVSRWRRESRPGGPLADTPFPPAKVDDSNGWPYWEEEQAEDILEWQDERRRARELPLPASNTTALAIVGSDGVTIIRLVAGDLQEGAVAFTGHDGSPQQVQEVVTTEGMAAALGVQPATVRRFLTKSRPGEQYAKRPFPPGQKGEDGRLYWTPDQVKRAIRWKARVAKGAGVGGGAAAHKSAIARWNPQRPRHLWYPTYRETKTKPRFCRYCGAAAIGNERVDACPGLAPERAARLSRVDQGQVRGAAGAKLIEAEMQAGLVQVQSARAKTAVFELTPAGTEWLNQFVALHPPTT